MLMVMPARLSTPVKASLVNCVPWSVLNTSGLPWLRKASSKQSTQNTGSLVGRLGLALGVDGAAHDAGQNALALLRRLAVNVNPTAPSHGRLIPD